MFRWISLLNPLHTTCQHQMAERLSEQSCNNESQINVTGHNFSYCVCEHIWHIIHCFCSCLISPKWTQISINAALRTGGPEPDPSGWLIFLDTRLEHPPSSSNKDLEIPAQTRGTQISLAPSWRDSTPLFSIFITITELFGPPLRKLAT